MNKMISIVDARKVTFESNAFREALSNANESIRTAAGKGKTEARVYIPSYYKVDVYRSLRSLLCADGYEAKLVTIERPHGSDEYVLDVSWRFK